MQTRFDQVKIDEDENIIESIGNGYIANAIIGNGISKVQGTLTDRRLYIQGKMYSMDNMGGLRAGTYDKSVDLEDITSTGFSYKGPNGWWAVFSVVFMLIGIYCFFDPRIIMLGILFLIIALALIVHFSIRRKFVYFIDYLGGNIMFDVSLVGYDQINAFNKSIRIAKEERKKGLAQEYTEVFKQGMQTN